MSTKRKQASTEKAPSGEPAKDLGYWLSNVIITLITLVKDIGLPGFIVSSVILLVIGWGSDSQKKQIIDNYILFQSPHGHIICAAIITALVAVMIAGTYYQRKLLKLEQREVKRLSDWKTEHQNVFGKRLNSSK